MREDGSLDVAGLMEAFQAWFRQISEHWIKVFQYWKTGPQLVLQGFLQRVVKGDGRPGREYGLGRGRTDLLVAWPRIEGEQRVAIECRVLRGGLDREIEAAWSSLTVTWTGARRKRDTWCCSTCGRRACRRRYSVAAKQLPAVRLLKSGVCDSAVRLGPQSGIPAGTVSATNRIRLPDELKRFSRSTSACSVSASLSTESRIRSGSRLGSFARWDPVCRVDSSFKPESESLETQSPHDLFMRNALATVLLEPFVGFGQRQPVFLAQWLFANRDVAQKGTQPVWICCENLPEANKLAVSHPVDLFVDSLADFAHHCASQESLPVSIRRRLALDVNSCAPKES